MNMSSPANRVVICITCIHLFHVTVAASESSELHTKSADPFIEGSIPAKAYAALADLAYQDSREKDKCLTHPRLADGTGAHTCGDGCRFCTDWEILKSTGIVFTEVYYDPLKNGMDHLRTDTPWNLTRLGNFKWRYCPNKVSPFYRLFKATQNGRTVYFMALRGSVPAANLVFDWIADIFGGGGLVPYFYRQADELTGLVLNQFMGKAFVLVGHSLGGGMAEYCAAQHGLLAVTFNSAHLSTQFPQKPGFLAVNYVASAHPNLWSSEYVHWLRLGGHFGDSMTYCINTVYHRWWSPMCGHSMDMVLKKLKEEAPITTPAPPDPLPPPRQETPNVPLPKALALVARGPTSVAEAPTPVYDGLRRATLGYVPKELKAPGNGHAVTSIWDLRLRAGATYDTRPSGGIEDENFRMFDTSLSQTPTPAEGGDWARSLSLDLSGTIPLYHRRDWATGGFLSLAEYDYDQLDQHDIRQNRYGWGFLWTDPDSTPDETFRQVSLYGIHQSIHIADEELTDFWGGSLMADGYHQSTFWWVGGEAGAVDELNSNRGDGWAVSGSAGLKWAFWDPSRQHQAQQRIDLASPTESDSVAALHFRLFGGRREATDDQFTNTQWGGGIGVVLPTSEHFRLFIEPSVRWTHRHIDVPASSHYSDHTYILKVQWIWNLEGDQESNSIADNLLGWELAACYTGVLNHPSDRSGNWDRSIVSIQATKRF